LGDYSEIKMNCKRHECTYCGPLKTDSVVLVIFQTLLRSVDSEISLANKVIDLAVFGHVVTTTELLQLAVERNGVVGSLGRLCMMITTAKVRCILVLSTKKN
jgi:hypothetical protein